MTRLNTQDGRELEKVNLESELGVAAAAAFAKAEPQQLAAQAWALPPAPQPAFLLMFVPGIPVQRELPTGEPSFWVLLSGQSRALQQEMERKR